MGAVLDNLLLRQHSSFLGCTCRIGLVMGAFACNLGNARWSHTLPPRQRAVGKWAEELMPTMRFGGEKGKCQ